MAKKEAENRQIDTGSLEIRNLRPADPTALIRDNPAALIVNKESYRLMASRFSPGRFDAPQVTRVVTYLPDGTPVVKDFIIDGMTRTKYVHDNAAEIKENNPGFEFQVNDVTQDVIDNSDVVLPSEKKDGQDALTLVQYLRAVIPPTVEHTKIAPDRIAAHLINGWRNMVGEQIAERYSAVTALNLLTHPNTNIATDQALQRELQKQLNHMINETEEERSRLQGALVQMAQIIRQSKINKPEVAKAAYVLVATDSEVIGGEQETARQIYGMLHSSDVEKKLQRAYPGEGIGEQSARELAREELGTNIARFFRDNKDKRNISELMGTFNAAYQDSDLTIYQLNDILGSEKPVQRYVEIKSDINRTKLEGKYRTQIERLGRQELSDAELRLLNNLGSRQYLTDSDIPGLLKAVNTAQSIISIARAQVVKFKDEVEKEKLVSAGVRPQLISQALIDIAESEEQILSAASPRAVAGKAQELKETLEIINGKINYQRSSHTIGEMIDKVSGVKFTEGFGGLQARQSAINFVIGQFRNVSDSNIQDVRRMVDQLVGLDPELFNDVISGRIRLAKALDDQKRRRGGHVSQTITPKKPGTDVRPQDKVDRSVTSTKPQPSPAEALRVGERVEGAETVIFIDRGDLDKVRIENNRRKLDELLIEIEQRLSGIDLDSSELTVDERRELERLIDDLGRLAFGRDGTSRVMKEDYPAMLVKVIGRQEAKVADEVDENYSYTGTGR